MNNMAVRYATTFKHKTSLLSKIKREERMFFYPVLFRCRKKLQAKEKQLPAEKPTPHATSTYKDFRDWKGDRNYVHYVGIRAVVFLASVRFARYIPQSAVQYFHYRGVFTLGIRYGSWYSVRT
jgi:hypothetical protein